MVNRKIGKLLADLEQAVVQEGLSEQEATEFVDGLEEEIEDLLDEEEDSSDSDQDGG